MLFLALEMNCMVGDDMGAAWQELDTAALCK
jgi:hypothetical protein